MPTLPLTYEHESHDELLVELEYRYMYVLTADLGSM
jgi:hypothetical protein